MINIKTNFITILNFGVCVKDGAIVGAPRRERLARAWLFFLCYKVSKTL